MARFKRNGGGPGAAARDSATASGVAYGGTGNSSPGGPGGPGSAPGSARPEAPVPAAEPVPAPAPAPPTVVVTDTSAPADAAGPDAERTPAAIAADKALTDALIRNTLVPTAALQKPLDEILPALTSFPDIDVELYALISLMIRQFVQSWYARVTDDKMFVFELLHVVAHITRSLEERIRKIDLELLVLDELPAIVDMHLRDFYQAKQKEVTAYAGAGGTATFESVFQSLQPHPALAEPGAELTFLAVLASGILAALLPSEDLGSAAERTFMRAVLAETVLLKTIDKLSEPFMVQEIVASVIESAMADRLYDNRRRRLATDAAEAARPRAYFDRDHKDGTWAALRVAAALVLADAGSALAGAVSALVVLVSLAQSAFAFLVTFRRDTAVPAGPKRPSAISVVSLAIFPTLARLLNLPARQPWLLSTLELLAAPVSISQEPNVLDRLCSYVFRRHMVASGNICRALQAARANLFPRNGPMGPPRVYPDDAEKRQILARVKRDIVDAVPAFMRRQVLGTTAALGGSAPGDDAGECFQAAEELLRPFESKFANKHLLYYTLDLVIVRILPELAEHTPEEIKRWRLGDEA
ncbi:PXA domain-containing protein [Dipodascopsis tothii]|uniref:PXA domain-containing protein n=1 Tax=Dipodascopsis tothii TaxID=44089 RepID=UPI0034CE7726